jgi:hypothetical protein
MVKNKTEFAEAWFNQMDIAGTQHPGKKRRNDPSLWDSPAHRWDQIQKDSNYENGRQF